MIQDITLLDISLFRSFILTAGQLGATLQGFLDNWLKIWSKEVRSFLCRVTITSRTCHLPISDRNVGCTL